MKEAIYQCDLVNTMLTMLSSKTTIYWRTIHSPWQHVLTYHLYILLVLTQKRITDSFKVMHIHISVMNQPYNVAPHSYVQANYNLVSCRCSSYLSFLSHNSPRSHLPNGGYLLVRRTQGAEVFGSKEKIASTALLAKLTFSRTLQELNKTTQTSGSSLNDILSH